MMGRIHTTPHMANLVQKGAVGGIFLVVKKSRVAIAIMRIEQSIPYSFRDQGIFIIMKDELSSPVPTTVR